MKGDEKAGLERESRREYFVVIFFVSMASKDDENDVEKSESDHSHVDSLVSAKLCMSKHILPVDSDWQWQKPTSKSRQMCRETVRTRVISQWSNLEHARSTEQSIASTDESLTIKPSDRQWLFSSR